MTQATMVANRPHKGPSPQNKEKAGLQKYQPHGLAENHLVAQGGTTQAADLVPHKAALKQLTQLTLA